MAAMREAMVRMKLALTHQGLAPERVQQILLAEAQYAEVLLKTLAATTVALDSVCAFVINR